MGRSGYTSLSIEEKQYAKLRRTFEITHVKDESFTVWAMDVLSTALAREKKVNNDYPGLRFVGNKTNGCVIEDQNSSILVEISVGKNLLSCSQDKGICKHVLFAVLHPSFEM